MTTYITTPIYYVNSTPHIGHAYTTIIADTYSRFRRLCGDEVRFQTGTDEHGEKIVQAAEKEGIGPREYAERISAAFRDTWPLLDIAPDHFIRTTNPEHIKVVQDILQKVYDQGDIYFSSYSGHYCKGCERFLTEKELVDGKCPDHLTVPDEVSEQNYFFRMSKYQDWLINHIKDNPDYITPERYRNEVLSFLSEPLEDLCISRPCSRLTWGIPLPFDKNFVTYVWFDALINYLTGIGYPDGADFTKYWSVAEHVVAKDILKPHAIYWPTMIQAAGLPPYQKLHVHGYWNVDETKMSKSIGNVIRPGDLVEEYGSDTVRYFLLREMSFGRDASFSKEAIFERRNADLANDIGNLFSRALTMLAKYADAKVPQLDEASITEEDRVLIAAIDKMLAEYTACMNGFEFHRALQSVWEVIGMLNRFIVTNAPWELAKDAANAGRLRTVLYFLAESLRILALVLRPMMPTAANKMAAALGLTEELDKAVLPEAGRWGGIQPGTALHVGEALFPRMEKKAASPAAPEKPKPQAKAEKKVEPAAQEEDGLISFDYFGKVELRVAEIVAAEKIAKAEKLLKLTVRAPEERTLVAGIAKHYSPEELIGRKVIIVANLKPAKLMGIASQGMVLAAKEKDADSNERLVLSAVAADIAVGSRVA
ncbi:MAG: methionyl-tRNA synthetase [Candidatus Electronema aureum]|uniref:Methionine--tRNA ligase n=1 Tax=Candidatus Electronema aureum TaxID=2005002 RepID=A0A521G047_9BACT|nr:MAG: methionyl-tRNA synthetase [Candidatus Electronema aureum]